MDAFNFVDTVNTFMIDYALGLAHVALLPISQALYFRFKKPLPEVDEHGQSTQYYTQYC